MIILDEAGRWLIVEECRGYFTDRFGCGKRLLIEEDDLHHLPGSCRTDNLISYTCENCGTENLTLGVPPVVKDRIFSRQCGTGVPR